MSQEADRQFLIRIQGLSERCEMCHLADRFNPVQRVSILSVAPG